MPLGLLGTQQAADQLARGQDSLKRRADEGRPSEPCGHRVRPLLFGTAASRVRIRSSRPRKKLQEGSPNWRGCLPGAAGCAVPDEPDVLRRELLTISGELDPLGRAVTILPGTRWVRARTLVDNRNRLDIDCVCQDGKVYCQDMRSKDSESDLTPCQWVRSRNQQRLISNEALPQTNETWSTTLSTQAIDNVRESG